MAASANRALVHISVLCDSCWAHVEEFLQSKETHEMEPFLNPNTILAATGTTHLAISSPLSLEA